MALGGVALPALSPAACELLSRFSFQQTRLQAHLCHRLHQIKMPMISPGRI